MASRGGSNGTKYPATVVGADPRTNVALIKIKAEGKTFPYVGSQQSPRDWLLAVGNPFGLGGTKTAGIISAQIPEKAVQFEL